MTVSELILSYWVFAKGHYQRDGRPTRELDNIRDALRPLRQLYGHSPAERFGPLALKAVRQSMIAAGLARTTINFRIGKIRRAFKWAAANELIAPAATTAWRPWRGSCGGREGVRETEPVKPVPDDHVAAVLPYVTKPVRAMIELQRLTGMRPGEVTAMRGADIDRNGGVWIYRLARHKTDRSGRDRVVALGPQAQAILAPWLVEDPMAFLFCPAAAETARHAERRRNRKTPTTPSSRARKPKKNPKRAPRPCYTRCAYATAIRRACKAAGIPAWAPNRLRHSAATKFRKHGGIEAARQILGHASASVTEVYAEADLGQVVAIMAAIG